MFYKFLQMNLRYCRNQYYTQKNNNIKSKLSSLPTITLAIILFSSFFSVSIINFQSQQHQIFAAEKPPDLKVINSGSKPNKENFNLTSGYKMEPIFWNLTLPTSITFDDKGNMYIAQSGFAE
ncbi:MAG: hypothetical protein H0X03_08625, partial [Nitrosopumilus sp.]|nr:hypothetical protein [Nitrosopumilus sp.]